MLKRIIEQVYPVSRRSLEAIEALIEREVYDSRAVFIQEGKPNNKEYFVLEGICRSFLINPRAEEVTISFYGAGSVIAPHVARTRHGLSLLNFQALTPLTLAAFDASAFYQLRMGNTEIWSFANAVLQNELLKKVEKEIGLACLTAKERLIRFRETYPALENLIPHPDIASYLGITNISLSRLRRELKG